MQPASRGAFRAVRRIRAPEEIIWQIRTLIATGHLQPGDRLPPERELSRALEVGRTSVREALRSMESLGFIEVRASQGAYLVDPTPPRQPDPLLVELFRPPSIQRTLFEVRRVLEPGLTALCARRATSGQIARMRTALAEQEASVQHGETGLPADAAFHALIAEATGNEILSSIMRSLMALLQQTREESLRLDGRPALSLEQNRAILHAIEDRNPAAAAHRMLEHIHAIESLVFPAREPPLRQPSVSVIPSPPGIPWVWRRGRRRQAPVTLAS